MFSLEILKMFERGLLNNEENRLNSEVEKCAFEKSDVRPLGLHKLLTLFILPIVGILISVTLFIFEMKYPEMLKSFYMTNTSLLQLSKESSQRNFEDSVFFIEKYLKLKGNYAKFEHSINEMKYLNSTEKD